MDEIIDYIKYFLTYGQETVAQQIGYTSDELAWQHYKVVVVPGKNILTGTRKEWTEPDFQISPTAEKQGEYVDEFGDRMGGTWVIQEDIIYNTFYLISLAGETHQKDLREGKNPEEWTDVHGRVSSLHSPLGKQGMALIPVIDEYARMLCKLLSAPLPEKQFSRIVLTHDVDTICHYRHLRGFLGGIRRGHLKAALAALSSPEHDSAYTFPWLIDQDKKLPQADSLYFFKAGRGKGHDYPQYELGGKDFCHLVTYLSKSGARFGLHSSYEAAGLIEEESSEEGAAAIIFQEKERLARHLQALDVPADNLPNRWHYLRLLSLSSLRALEDAGITDDYTVGWADSIGFRLGTTRPVRWIDPIRMRLTNLTLHPLSIMDCTLTNDCYMHIQNEEEAFYMCQQVMDKVRKHGGELVLLWHNSNITEDSYLKTLYADIIDYLNQTTL